MLGKISSSLYLVFFVSIILTSCGRGPGKGDIVVKIGGEIITVQDLDRRISNLPERYRQVIEKRKGEFLQEVINDTLLYQEAKRMGLDKDKEVMDVVNEAKKKILIARLLKERIDDTIEISDEEVKSYYEANKDSYLLPEILRVSHILVKTKEEAENIFKTLESGASFEETAKMKSLDPTAQSGGDIGYFPKGQLIPEFENASSSLKIGEISPPVKTKLGYHIIKLTDRKKRELMSVDKVSEKIKTVLRTQKRREKFNELLKDLSSKSKIEINESAWDKKES